MTEENSRAYKDQYMLRLPDGMRDQIKAAAAHNNRSMNAEIVQALDYWLQIELPYDIELGAGTNAKAVGKKDWDEAIEDAERITKADIQKSIWLMQRLLKDIRFSEGKFTPGSEGSKNDNEMPD